MSLGAHLCGIVDVDAVGVSGKVFVRLVADHDVDVLCELPRRLVALVLPLDFRASLPARLHDVLKDLRLLAHTPPVRIEALASDLKALRGADQKLLKGHEQLVLCWRVLFGLPASATYLSEAGHTAEATARIATEIVTVHIHSGGATTES